MSGEPWGYLLPLRDGPPPLELREDTATVGTAPSCTLPLDTAASGLPADAPPQVLFAVRGDASSGHAQLRSQADVVRVNDQSIPRGRQKTLQHGARIAFQPDGATYVYVSRKESDSFRAPPQVLEEYLVGHRVGKGGFGNVYAVFHKRDNYSRKAVKIVEPKKEEIFQCAQREARIVMSLDHPCIIKTYSITRFRNDYYLLMEFMIGGDLSQYVNEQHLLTEPQTKLLFFQLALAVEYLHYENICHRDLSPANILLQKRNPKTLIKVTDFGLAKEKYWDSSPDSYAGTKLYLAPEIVREDESYTNAVDIWSMGIILFYSLTGTVPFKNIKQRLRSRQVVEYIPEHWNGVSVEAQTLVKRMLTPHANGRISVTEVLEDSWLRDDTMSLDVALLPDLQDYLDSRKRGGEHQPWGYLLPLDEGPPPLEFRVGSTMVTTEQMIPLHLNPISTSSSLPRKLFAVLRGSSVGETILRCETDVLFVNGKKITRSNKENLQHGAPISFVVNEASYVFANHDESDSFSAPQNVLKNYLVVPYLISGSFGNVCILFDKKMKYQRKAMKIVEPRREVQIIKNLKFPCIIEVFDILETNNQQFLIMEYMAGGDLGQFVEDKGPLLEDQAKLIFYQVALAVLYLHEIKICLRNLKLTNVLLLHRNPHTIIKITTSYVVKGGTSFETMPHAASKHIQAPELLSSSTCTLSVDVWSMGIILFYSLTSTLPTLSLDSVMDTEQHKNSFKIYYKKLIDKCYTSKLDTVSSMGSELLKRMLIVKADERVTALQVVEDPWLQDEVMRENVRRLTGIQNFFPSQSDQAPPWGYLLALEDHLPFLELRERSATVGTHDSCTLILKASLVGLPDYIAPHIFCTVYQSTDGAVLSIEFDKVYLNGEELLRGDVRVIENGARIGFGAANYMFVNREDNDSFKSPADILQKYLVGHCLGSGGFGKVFVLFDKESNYQPQAVKIMEPKNKTHLLYATREAKIMLSLKHPCVIETFTIKQFGQQLFVFMEYMAGGDLRQFVNDQRPLSEKETKLIFFQLSLAVDYLHSTNVCHRDLKPANILLQQRNPHTLIKVSDFGLAKDENVDSSLTTFVGTKQYLAPEVIIDNRYTNSVDVWSMGIILYYGLTGDLPFRSLEEAFVCGHAVQFPVERWGRVSSQAEELVRRMLQVNAGDRVSATQVVEDLWLRDDDMREDVFRLMGLYDVRLRKPSTVPTPVPFDAGRWVFRDPDMNSEDVSFNSMGDRTRYCPCSLI